MISARLIIYAVIGAALLAAIAFIYDAGRDAEEGKQAREALKGTVDAVERSQPGPVLGLDECRQRLREGRACAGPR